MRELQFIRAGRLEWRERPAPALRDARDALVRPIVAGRCDGDTLPIHRHVSRAMQFGIRAGLIDPVVGSICGPVPFRGPFGIGHECVAEVVEVGADIPTLRRGDLVVVPWAISCGECRECRLGLTAKCSTTRTSTLAAFGFGPASGPWGGMVADLLRIPFADHMLVPLPAGVDPLRVAAASDNLADAWRCVIPGLRIRPGGKVLVLGGAAQSIGLYAAGLAVRHGAEVVDYVDHRRERLDIAEKLGARAHSTTAKGKIRRTDIPRRDYDIAVEGTSTAAGVDAALRSLAPGGFCRPVGYYLPVGTKVPLMHMYANDATVSIGVSHVRPILPDLLDFVARHDFPAETVTTLTADWDDAPEAYTAHTTKLVLHRAPLHAAADGAAHGGPAA
ncbi:MULTISPECIES: zinc-binding dehydrogenase [Nocardia]|uniref:zinc-dependent alcohol dehydrogenase n=1 Tax=Nocardia TaxID=1817 RepID=UPI0007E92C8D|nr:MULTISPECIES: alcohol dehydrogenase catalytic domain-containing protein [Nocardia]OBF83945.1 zinc-binding alcohol dehydrogenase [Mycobacterium sp. 852002-51759_SCH5129042]MBF6275313.1 alcohol dehydrogenase catalytic domain-containing protein [Nocardia nova]OBA47925.1 zinc-binding alcohol dehydrogenase [Nocardia sp. 852002-51101_SCH5132738]OBB53423.1 zinc-binding alcohol dehydrogenase [Nocardia sp. 852002-51244_SCH5132740]PPI99790.1 zinc-binding alcohol dehydrogenase [Nocardia nova]